MPGIFNFVSLQKIRYLCVQVFLLKAAIIIFLFLLVPSSHTYLLPNRKYLITRFPHFLAHFSSNSSLLNKWCVYTQKKQRTPFSLFRGRISRKCWLVLFSPSNCFNSRTYNLPLFGVIVCGKRWKRRSCDYIRRFSMLIRIIGFHWLP